MRVFLIYIHKLRDIMQYFKFIYLLYRINKIVNNENANYN